MITIFPIDPYRNKWMIYHGTCGYVNSYAKLHKNGTMAKTEFSVIEAIAVLFRYCPTATYRNHWFVFDE